MRGNQRILAKQEMHVVGSPGQLSHRAFLDLSGNDPSESFASALIAACGESGPVFVYNAGFETARISELARRNPGWAGSWLPGGD